MGLIFTRMGSEANLQAAKKKLNGPCLDSSSQEYHPLLLQNVYTMPLDWNNAEELQAVMNRATWDVVLGSDLIYSEQGITLLAKLLTSGIVFFYNFYLKRLVFEGKFI